MLQNIGISEFVLIAVAALVLFGPDKLPDIGRKLGQAVRQFRSGAAALIEEVTRDPEQRRTPPSPSAPVRTAEPSAAAAPSDSRASAAASDVPASAGAPAAGSPAAEASADSAVAVKRPRRAPDPRRLPE
jgi:sec-independent protein translocase protein TatA